MNTVRAAVGHLPDDADAVGVNGNWTQLGWNTARRSDHTAALA